MNDNRPNLTLVVPIFKEEHRFPSFLKDVDSFFKRLPGAVEVLFVEDPPFYSPTNAFLPSSNIQVHRIQNSKRLGRGKSIFNGLQRAQGDFIVLSSVDLAVPLGDIMRIYQAFIEQPEVSEKLFVGNRYSPKKMRTGERSSIRNIFENIERDKLKHFALSDPTSPYLGMNQKTLQRLVEGMEASKMRRWFYGSNLISCAGQLRIPIEEVPVHSNDTLTSHFQWWMSFI